MKSTSRIFFLLLAFSFIFFSLNSLGNAKANVSRSPNWRSVSPRIAVDSGGNLQVVWAEYYSDTSGDAFYSKYNASTQVWSAPINLSNSSLVHSDEYRPVGVDVDGASNIYVFYLETNKKLKLRVYSGGSWGSAFEVATANDAVDSARIAVDPSGNIFTTWWTINFGAVYSRARIGGNWENVATLSRGGRRSKFPNIAVGNNVVYCCWQEGGYAPGYQTAFVKRGKNFNDSWSSSQLVSASDKPQGNPDVEIDGNDVAHIVWQTRMTDDWQYFVHYSYWTGNGWSSPQAISSQILLLYASIYERGNNLFVCWSVGSWGYGIGVRYNTRVNGSWTGQASVADSAGSTFTDVAAGSSPDQLYFVWDDIGKSGGSWEVYCNVGTTGPPPPPPDNPVARFSYSPTSGAPPLEVAFDGSASYDPNGSIVAYDWDFGDDTTGSGQIVTHTYNTAGIFAAGLTVTDNDGKTGSVTHTVEVIKANEPPVAEFSFSPTTGIYPLQVNFDASASHDPDGNIVQYSWDFGDGRTGSGRTVSHVYTRSGTFLIKLTVRDNSGGTDTKSKSIVVLALFKPLNIKWATHADESLFQTRYVIEVTWEKNPENDKLGVQIILYRIYRKKEEENNNAYRVIGEVTGDTYRYIDKDAGGKNIYSYTVTAVDNQGHESPIVGVAGSFSNPFLNKKAQNTERTGKIARW